MKQRRIMIADIGDAFATLCADILRKNGYWVVTRPQTEEALLQCFRTEHPDDFIFNVSEITMDIVGFIRRISSVSDNRFTVFFANELPFLERKLTSLGVTCLLQPDDTETLTELLQNHCMIYGKQPQQERTAIELKREITALLHSCQVPIRVRGFQYLRSAILINSQRTFPNDSCIMTIYDAVAGEYAIPPARVERAIRTAIDIAWQEMNKSGSRKPFSYLPLPCFPNHKPTNSEFVALASDWIRLRSADSI